MNPQLILLALCSITIQLSVIDGATLFDSSEEDDGIQSEIYIARIHRQGLPAKRTIKTSPPRRTSSRNHQVVGHFKGLNQRNTSFTPVIIETINTNQIMDLTLQLSQRMCNNKNGITHHSTETSIDMANFSSKVHKGFQNAILSGAIKPEIVTILMTGMMTGNIQNPENLSGMLSSVSHDGSKDPMEVLAMTMIAIIQNISNEFGGLKNFTDNLFKLIDSTSQSFSSNICKLLNEAGLPNSPEKVPHIDENSLTKLSNALLQFRGMDFQKLMSGGTNEPAPNIQKNGPHSIKHHQLPKN